MSEIQLPLFDGATYDEALDEDRLSSQQGRVRFLMRDGLWRTLAEVAEATNSPEASVSSRLRDLRKPRWGGYIVDSERVRKGLWRYRIRKP